jgi:hypothetical protein
VIGLGGNITGLVPPLVERRLRERLKKEDDTHFASTTSPR